MLRYKLLIMLAFFCGRHYMMQPCLWDALNFVLLTLLIDFMF